MFCESFWQILGVVAVTMLVLMVGVLFAMFMDAPSSWTVHMFSGNRESNGNFKSDWPKSCMICGQVFLQGFRDYQEHLIVVHNWPMQPHNPDPK